MMWGWYFDPLYFILIAPGFLLAMWAQWRVSSAYAEASRIPAGSGYSGAETAAALLRNGGIRDVQIETVPGELTDHYSPGEKVLRLSPDVYEGRSLAALGIAAHECGHAFQDAEKYALMSIRNSLVPAANFGSNASWFIIMAGIVLMGWAHMPHIGKPLVIIGCAAFSLVVVFQLVNLPVEFDASRRARVHLLENGLITAEEDVVVKRVLSAAALTYVAATLTAILTLLYFLIRSGLLGGRSND